MWFLFVPALAAATVVAAGAAAITLSSDPDRYWKHHWYDDDNYSECHTGGNTTVLRSYGTITVRLVKATGFSRKKKEKYYLKAFTSTHADHFVQFGTTETVKKKKDQTEALWGEVIGPMPLQRRISSFSSPPQFGLVLYRKKALGLHKFVGDAIVELVQSKPNQPPPPYQTTNHVIFMDMTNPLEDARIQIPLRHIKKKHPAITLDLIINFQPQALPRKIQGMPANLCVMRSGSAPSLIAPVVIAV